MLHVLLHMFNPYSCLSAAIPIRSGAERQSIAGLRTYFATAALIFALNAFIQWGGTRSSSAPGRPLLADWGEPTYGCFACSAAARCRCSEGAAPCTNASVTFVSDSWTLLLVPGRWDAQPAGRHGLDLQLDNCDGTRQAEGLSDRGRRREILIEQEKRRVATPSVNRYSNVWWMTETWLSLSSSIDGLLNGCWKGTRGDQIVLKSRSAVITVWTV